MVEKVFDFCTPTERAHFFHQLPGFEDMLKEDGIHLVKLWLNVGRAEQLSRFLARERDPLKQWKLSWIDVEGLRRWDEYTIAIRETFAASHSPQTPWVVIRSDDKRRARVNAIRAVLRGLDYPGKNEKLVMDIDEKICGGPEIWQS